jgi:hypothetical protein
VLSATRTFFSAYKRAVAAISRYSEVVQTDPESDHTQSLEMKTFGNVSLYWGRATAEEVKKKVPASPGVYILVSYLDSDLLKDLRLPKEWDRVPAVIRVPHHDLPEDFDVGDPIASWAGTLAFTNDAAVGKDTVAWRKRFMDENPSLTSNEIAEQATSLAENRAAIANRWKKEGKLFSVRFEGTQRFPSFQLEHGEPLPAVAEVIKVFGQQATGWDLAYFFSSPNTNIGGRKPVDLLKQDQGRLVSLAQAFVHPADVF